MMSSMGVLEPCHRCTHTFEFVSDLFDDDCKVFWV